MREIKFQIVDKYEVEVPFLEKKVEKYRLFSFLKRMGYNVKVHLKQIKFKILGKNKIEEK
jgi:hypothetical protein